LESDDSNGAILTPLDTFPPAAPQGVVAAVLPGAEAGKSVVDLSWSISIEADLAGYRVYRSEKQGERGELLTAELLLTPAYRDNSVTIGQNYWYSVGAVDRSGNESALSDPVSVEIAQP
jgi:fibronectin type 3 domain-containing protein